MILKGPVERWPASLMKDGAHERDGATVVATFDALCTIFSDQFLN